MFLETHSHVYRLSWLYIFQMAWLKHAYIFSLDSNLVYFGSIDFVSKILIKNVLVSENKTRCDNSDSQFTTIMNHSIQF